MYKVEDFIAGEDARVYGYIYLHQAKETLFNIYL